MVQFNLSVINTPEEPLNWCNSTSMLKEIRIVKNMITLIGEQTHFTFMIFIETYRKDPWSLRPDENKIFVCTQEDYQMVHEPIFRAMVKEEFSAWLLQNQPVLEPLVAVSKVFNRPDAHLAD